jgi:hypothetical protein
MNLSDGMRLGPYEILAPLGAGGMARCNQKVELRTQAKA